jgi:NAD-dependent protein deacetylase/lipoamidase
MQIPDALLDSLRAARHIMVLSGAGISAESGLATFRTPQTGLQGVFQTGRAGNAPGVPA